MDFGSSFMSHFMEQHNFGLWGQVTPNPWCPKNLNRVPSHNNNKPNQKDRTFTSFSNETGNQSHKRIHFRNQFNTDGYPSRNPIATPTYWVHIYIYWSSTPRSNDRRGGGGRGHRPYRRATERGEARRASERERGRKEEGSRSEYGASARHTWRTSIGERSREEVNGFGQAGGVPTRVKCRGACSLKIRTRRALLYSDRTRPDPVGKDALLYLHVKNDTIKEIICNLKWKFIKEQPKVNYRISISFEIFFLNLWFTKRTWVLTCVFINGRVEKSIFSYWITQM